MIKIKRARYQLFLAADLSEQFETLAARPGARKSSILAAALAAEEDEAARAIGRDRFAAFVSRVGQQLASGRQTFNVEELS